MLSDKIDRTFIRKGKIKEQGNDFLFWDKNSYEDRLTVIEQIGTEYNTWKYGSEKGIQRVFKIIKLKKQVQSYKF